MTFQSQREQIQPGNGPVTQIPLPVLLPSIPRQQLHLELTAGQRETFPRPLLAAMVSAACSLGAGHLQSFPTQAQPQHRTRHHTSSSPDSQFTEGQRPRVKLKMGGLTEPTFTWPSTSAPRFSESPAGLRYRSQALGGLVKEGNSC